MTAFETGCGTAKTPGALGVDPLPLKGVDVVCDLTRFPWPFTSHSADRLIFNHSFN
jgi:hypothetical protein